MKILMALTSHDRWLSPFGRSERQINTSISEYKVRGGKFFQPETGLAACVAELIDPKSDLPENQTAAGISVPYLASRSKIRNWGADSYGKASLSCWTTHGLVGCRVMLKCRMRRRSWPMTKKQ